MRDDASGWPIFRITTRSYFIEAAMKQGIYFRSIITGRRATSIIKDIIKAGFLFYIMLHLYALGWHKPEEH
jgi:hypothetical protein